MYLYAIYCKADQWLFSVVDWSINIFDGFCIKLGSATFKDALLFSSDKDADSIIQLILKSKKYNDYTFFIKEFKL